MAGDVISGDLSHHGEASDRPATNRPAASAPATAPVSGAAGRPEPYPLSPAERARATPAGGTATAMRPRPVVRLMPPRPPVRTYVAEGWICLLVALSWGPAAHAVYTRIGTMIFMRGINQAMATGIARQPNPGVARSGIATSPGARPEATHGFSIFPPVQPPARDGSRGFDPGRAGETSLNADRAAARQIELAEMTRVAWAVGTFALIGLIGASGLAAVVQRMGWRLVFFGLICTTFGAAAAALAVTHYRPLPVAANRPAWQWLAAAALDWALGVTQGRQAWVGHLAVATGSAGFFGLFALRPGSRPSHWIGASVAAMVGATFLTLVGISVLQTYARFPALPSWVYVFVAAGQSIFAWILLVMLGRRAAGGGMEAARARSG